MAAHQRNSPQVSESAQRWMDYRARARKRTRLSAAIGSLGSLLLVLSFAKWMIHREFPDYEGDNLIAEIREIVLPKPKRRDKPVPPPPPESPAKPVDEPETPEPEMEEPPLEETIPPEPIVVRPHPDSEPAPEPETAPAPEPKLQTQHMPSEAPGRIAVEGFGAIDNQQMPNGPGHARFSDIGGPRENGDRPLRPSPGLPRLSHLENTRKNNGEPRTPETVSIRGGFSQNGSAKELPETPSPPVVVDGITTPVPSPASTAPKAESSPEPTVNLRDDFEIVDPPKPRFPDGVNPAIQTCQVKVRMAVEASGLPAASTIEVVEINPTILGASDARLTQADKRAFRREALRIARKYIFQPVRRNGEPQAFRVVITLDFERVVSNKEKTNE